MKKIAESWYSDTHKPWLKPISAVFSLLSGIRRTYFKIKKSKVYRASVPVIVVGNISVGGTGKTPLIVYLAKQLLDAGYRPGIVSRGYGSKAPEYPYHVTADSPFTYSGDEALLIARNTGCPVVIDPKRTAALKSLEQTYDCNVILSDDGMQHYAMARDIEIAVIDGRRGFGNGELLPAGPLREKPERLDDVDFVIYNGESSLSFKKPSYQMTLIPSHLCHLQTGKLYPIETIIDELTKKQDAGATLKQKVHAVAGIGNPARFFSSLCDCGFDIISHIFDDHHNYSLEDISFNDEYEVVMTEKDAVKCSDFARSIDWYLRVEAQINDAFFISFLERLKTFSV